MDPLPENHISFRDGTSRWIFNHPVDRPELLLFRLPGKDIFLGCGKLIDGQGGVLFFKDCEGGRLFHIQASTTDILRIQVNPIRVPEDVKGIDEILGMEQVGKNPSAIRVVYLNPTVVPSPADLPPPPFFGNPPATTHRHTS